MSYPGPESREHNGPNSLKAAKEANVLHTFGVQVVEMAFTNPTWVE